jgi:hypothetical protein
MIKIYRRDKQMKKTPKKDITKKQDNQIKQLFPDWDNLKITPKEGLFIYHYCTNHFNATKAYTDAGYTATTPESASVMACMILRKPKFKILVKRYLNEYLNIHKDKLETEIFDIYYNQMTYDIAEIIDNEGQLIKNLSEYTKEQRQCIEHIETKYAGKVELVKYVVVKLADRNKAADKLAKYIEMMKEPDTNLFIGIGDETMRRLEKLRVVKEEYKDEIIQINEEENDEQN